VSKISQGARLGRYVGLYRCKYITMYSCTTFKYSQEDMYITGKKKEVSTRHARKPVGAYASGIIATLQNVKYAVQNKIIGLSY